VNLLDVLILTFLVAAGVSGFRRGALLQLLAYGGLALGLVVGAILAPPIASLWENHAAQAGIAVTVVLSLAGIGNAAGWLAGSYVRHHTRRTWFGGADAAGGSVVSVVAVLLATWFLALNLVNGPFPTLSREIRSSAVVRTIGSALPRPPSLLGEVRKFFNRFGFPEVFTGLPPPPAGSVQWPSDAQARRAFDAASDSTVRIVGEACGEIQSGTGFVVAPNLVVTNAHVVAGVQEPFVQDESAGSQRGTTVLFDPATDLAMLRVEIAPGAPLRLAPEHVVRGTGGAVIGFPGGGDLFGTRAAVRRALDAEGRDIYSEASVVREVYELQAEVRPGDSGGPFVLPDGTVAGVVFAASSTDPGVGYAIVSTEVVPDVQAAQGLTTAVSSGPCLR
jgi:S1-C subfamily serine protease